MTNSHTSKVALSIASILGLVTVTAIAGTVTIPNTFTAGTSAKAADVNANFSAVATSINATAADVTALQSAAKGISSGLTARDSKGALIGQYYPANNGVDLVVMHSAGGHIFTAFITPSFFGSTLANGAELAYASTDCSGTPYVVESATTPSLIPNAAQINLKAYLPGPTPNTLTVQSTLTNQGAMPGLCTNLTNPSLPGGPSGVFTTSVAFAVAETVDLSVFVPPFTAQ